MGKGTEKLGGLFRTQMHEVSRYNIGMANVVFGRITADYGLDMDGVDYNLPKGDYLVCRKYAGSLAINDRVLVAIYNNEPVVIDAFA